MKFDYFGNLEDWAEENGYDSEDVVGEKELFKKRSSYVELYLYKEATDTYAKFTAYSDYDNGYYDITLEQEGLNRKEKQVIVSTYEYI